MSRHLRLAVIVLAVSATACGAGQAVDPTPIPAITDDPIGVQVDTIPTTAPPTETTPPRVVVGPVEPVPPIGERNLAGKASGPLDVYMGPYGQEAVRTLPAATVLGTPTVVRILGEAGPRFEVALPGRPNGATGWVDRSDLELFPALRSIEIDLGDRILAVFDGEEVVFTSPIGIGSPSSPTPTGSFFITDAVIITAANGPWGPFAFGLSARSNTVTEFNGGDGIIGIHGTNRPRSIGNAQSLGCVRLPNDMIGELFDLVGVGTPVEISA
jgi:lipoprotein-anchoring transpeptidase ErfK/SrfK